MALSARKCVFCALAIFVARLDRGSFLSVVDDGPPFFPPLRLSASLFRRLRCLAFCPPAIEREGVGARPTPTHSLRDYIERERRKTDCQKVSSEARESGRKTAPKQKHNVCVDAKSEGFSFPRPSRIPKFFPVDPIRIEDEEGASVGACELRGPRRQI